MNALKEPLFSIACVTYNQEELITECLDSIARQDYGPIELVLCDDASTDGTTRVVEDWLAANKNRFENAVFLKNTANLGISATHDRALRQTSGKWVKYIAGDDILADNCASCIAEFCKETGTTWGQALVKPFFGTLEDMPGIELPFRRFRKYFSYDPAGQFRMFARSCFFCAPGNFFERSLLEGIGFLDPEFRTFEDWHTWLRLTKAGHSAKLLPETLVFWRRHPKSLSFSAMDIGNVSFCQDQVRVVEKYVLPNEKDLDWVTRKHLSCYLAYMKLFIQEGATHKAHRKARWLKLKDPLWWKDFGVFIRDKILLTFKGA